MSHKATNWAIQQRGIRPAAKLVLWHLCDRYHPDHGCFPAQETLAHDCEMSRRSVNDNLDTLEAAGLIRRERQIDEHTRRQKSTRYILAFEDGFAPTSDDPCAKSAHGAVCKSTSEPCANSRKSRVQNLHTNSVREPVIEPCAAETAPQKIDFVSFQDEFIRLFPRLGNAEETERELRKALEDGADPDAILWGARCYGLEQKGNHTRYIAYSENWVRDKRWKSHSKPKSGKEAHAAVLKGRAKAIRECQRWVPAHVSAASAREMIALGMVTEAECLAAGLRP